MTSYPETHQDGLITIERNLRAQSIYGDLGIQISSDGRVWICIDGQAVIRFKPLRVDLSGALNRRINRRISSIEIREDEEQ